VAQRERDEPLDVEAEFLVHQIGDGILQQIGDGILQAQL
jgi:hypothetical protein